MKTYKITVIDDFFEMELAGEFQAETEADAVEEARDYYACELDTFIDNITILKVEELLLVTT